MRVFLDAHILFSAAKIHGAVLRLFPVLISKGRTLVAEAYVISEARRNLQLKYTQATRDLESMLEKGGIITRTTTSLLQEFLPILVENGRPVLAAAVRPCVVKCNAGNRNTQSKYVDLWESLASIHDPTPSELFSSSLPALNGALCATPPRFPVEPSEAARPLPLPVA